MRLENLFGNILEGMSDIKYVHISSEDELVGEAYRLGKTEISVLSDKEPSIVAMDGDEVVGVLFTSMVGYKFSFDIVVDEKHRNIGVGSKLAEYGIEEFKELHSDMPEIELQLDVVNPRMRKILERMGLKILEHVAGDRVIMGHY